MGFDNECILNIQSLAGEYFCPVCRQLVYPNEAIQTQCTHLYCKPCLTYIVNTTKACPYDGYLVTEADAKPLVDSNKSIADAIGVIQVHCLYHRSGCTWQGSFSDCITHCTNCPYGNSPVVCNRCGTQIVHRQVQEHAQNCPGTQPLEQQDKTQTQANATIGSQTEQNQSAVSTAQSQPTAQTTGAASAQTTAPQVAQGQNQANSTVPQQAPTVAVTPEQWYQYYQQYYQQYPQYEQYQQQFQQYNQYQQHGYQQYQPYLQVQQQVHPQVVQGEPQAQAAQPPMLMQPHLHPQGQVTPPTQSHPQAQVTMPAQLPAQSLAQPTVQVQVPSQNVQVPSKQPVQSLPPQLPQHHKPTQVQLLQPSQIQTQPQNPHQAPHHAQLPPTQVPQPQMQPHLQGGQRYVQTQQQVLPQQQSQMQPHPQMHSQVQMQPHQPMPPQTQPYTQQHTHPQFQQQSHPTSQPQQLHPHTHQQVQHPPPQGVTGHHSYPQPQPQFPPSHTQQQMAPGPQQPIQMQPQQPLAAYQMPLPNQFPPQQMPPIRPQQPQAQPLVPVQPQHQPSVPPQHGGQAYFPPQQMQSLPRQPLQQGMRPPPPQQPYAQQQSSVAQFPQQPQSRPPQSYPGQPLNMPPNQQQLHPKMYPQASHQPTQSQQGVRPQGPSPVHQRPQAQPQPHLAHPQTMAVPGNPALNHSSRPMQIQGMQQPLQQLSAQNQGLQQPLQTSSTLLAPNPVQGSAVASLGTSAEEKGPVHDTSNQPVPVLVTPDSGCAERNKIEGVKLNIAGTDCTEKIKASEMTSGDKIANDDTANDKRREPNGNDSLANDGEGPSGMKEDDLLEVSPVLADNTELHGSVKQGTEESTKTVLEVSSSDKQFNEKYNSEETKNEMKLQNPQEQKDVSGSVGSLVLSEKVCQPQEWKGASDMPPQSLKHDRVSRPDVDQNVAPDRSVSQPLPQQMAPLRDSRALHSRAPENRIPLFPHQGPVGGDQHFMPPAGGHEQGQMPPRNMIHGGQPPFGLDEKIPGSFPLAQGQDRPLQRPPLQGMPLQGPAMESRYLEPTAQFPPHGPPPILPGPLNPELQKGNLTSGPLIGRGQGMIPHPRSLDLSAPPPGTFQGHWYAANGILPLDPIMSGGFPPKHGPGALEGPASMRNRDSLHGPDGPLMQPPMSNLEHPSMMPPARTGFFEGKQGDSRPPMTADHEPFRTMMSGFPDKGPMSRIHEDAIPHLVTDERFGPPPVERLRPFPQEGSNPLLGEGIRPYPADKTVFEEDLKKFPRPGHPERDMHANKTLQQHPAGQPSSVVDFTNPLERGQHGINFDNGVKPDGPSSGLLPRPLPAYPPMGPPTRPTEMEDRLQHFGPGSGERMIGPFVPSSDFLRAAPEFGRPRYEGFPPPRSPGRDYPGVASGRLVAGSLNVGSGRASHPLDDFGGKELSAFRDRNKPFNFGPSDVASDSFHTIIKPSALESQFPPFSSALGAATEFPALLRRGNPNGPGIISTHGGLPSHFRGTEPFGPGSMSSHLRIGEPFGPGMRPGEARYPNNFPMSAFPGEGGPYNAYSRRHDMELFDNSRKRKSGSTGWCRICKVDCETVEGLEIHSQTREHQKMAMNMVMSIKQDSAKKQKLSAGGGSSR